MNGRDADKREGTINSLSADEVKTDDLSADAEAAKDDEITEGDQPNDDDFNSGDFGLNCASGIWQVISELGSQIAEAFKQVFSGLWSGISEFFGMVGEAAKNVFEGIFRGIGIFFGAIGTGLMWVGRVIVKPVFVSGANIGGFFLDKFLLGSPGLHDYFQHGLWPSNVPTVWRDWVRSNSGWDIYETMGKVGDNVVGTLLGGGIGWLNLFNHFVTSAWRNIWNNSHLLGKEGVFGERHPLADQRNTVVKIIFGILSLPLVAPIVAVTNSFDAVGAVAKNLWYSFYRNLRSMNFLSDYGIFGKCRAYEDNRHLAVRIIFGVLALPAVAPIAIVTNVFDLIITGTWHFVNQSILSLDRNLNRTFNIVLGKYGMFGDRRKFSDKRYLALKLIFGALTLPIVAPLAIITNAVDLVTTGIWQFIKQSALSFYRNLRSNMNFLSEYGVFSKRTPYVDDRNLAVRIIFGALTFPLVAPLALVTNAADLLFTSVYHIYNNLKLSLYHNLRSTFNIVLGKYGMFGEWRKYEDTRHLAVRILFGALTLPIVGPLVIVSNVLDILLKGTWEFFRHSLLSIGRNLRKTFNIVLGGWGVLGNKRHEYEDNRNLAVKIVFGLLTLPIVAPLAIISNAFDVAWSAVWQTIKHSCLSLFFNIDQTFNIILGSKHGIFCERSNILDNRNLAVRLLFGALTLPIVAPIVIVSNAIDLVFTGIQQFFKQSALSIERNLTRSFNIVLGDVGLFGPRHLFKDPRNMAVKVLFGALTLPIVAPLALITNSVDLVGAYLRHWRHTILNPAIIVTGTLVMTVLAVPTFVLRKTLKGLYNCTLGPIVDCIQGRTPSGLSMLKGAANVITLGGFSLASKVFKACTGYTHRFGFGYRDTPATDEKEGLVTNHFAAAQHRFRTAIHLATKGRLPGAQDKMGYFRPVMRVVYGMRNKAEEILKAFHDEYLAYVDHKTLKGKDIASLSIAGFFGRKTAEKYAAVEARVKARVNLHEDEKTMFNAVKGYLQRP